MSRRNPHHGIVALFPLVVWFANPVTLLRLSRVNRRCRVIVTSESEGMWELLSHVYMISSLPLRGLKGSRDLVTRVASLSCLHGMFTFTADEQGYKDHVVVTRAVIIFTPLTPSLTHARLFVRPRGAPVVQGRALMAFNGIAKYDFYRGHVVINFAPSTSKPSRNVPVQETRWILSICKRAWLNQKPEEFRSHAGGIRMINVPGESPLSCTLEAVALGRSLVLPPI